MSLNILMVAAENDALEGGKVGGIGDVVRDIAPALADIGHQVDVVVPGYLKFSNTPGAQRVATVDVEFAQSREIVEIYRVPGKRPHLNVTQWVLEHPLFAAGGIGQIYCNDPADKPFSTDAGKFALFCAAVARAICDKTFGSVDVIHLHDWHAAMLAILRAFDPQFKALQKIHTVYSIHNLSLQGVRPLTGDASSLSSWFPELAYEQNAINDPRAPHCINPMRAGIRLADRVHAVSPTYCEEILRPSDPISGRFGGEGLESDLQEARETGRLFGILNGCEYPKTRARKPSFQQVLKVCEAALLRIIGDNPTVESAHLIALRRIEKNASRFRRSPPNLLMTSVGRLTDQKVMLLRQPLENGNSALENLLDEMGNKNVLLLMGSGDSNHEQFFTRVSSRFENFIFLKGYSEQASDIVYRGGDLFLMPSSFEPCGISQMLAMRAGQPCLVNAVGGLCDTVTEASGFSIVGQTPQQQSTRLVELYREIVTLRNDHPERWAAIQANASAARFPWSDSARQYESLLYGG